MNGEISQGSGCTRLLYIVRGPPGERDLGLSQRGKRGTALPNREGPCPERERGLSRLGKDTTNARTHAKNRNTRNSYTQYTIHSTQYTTTPAKTPQQRPSRSRHTSTPLPIAAVARSAAVWPPAGPQCNPVGGPGRWPRPLR